MLGEGESTRDSEGKGITLLGKTPESREKYTPSVNDTEKQNEMVDRYQKAKEVVGEKMAQDIIQQLASGDKVVNHEQFKHDMLTNPKFMQTILQEWGKLNTDVYDLIMKSGFATDFLGKNKQSITEGIQKYADGIGLHLPKDVTSYQILPELRNGEFTFNLSSTTDDGKSYDVKLNLTPSGQIYLGEDIFIFSPTTIS